MGLCGCRSGLEIACSKGVHDLARNILGLGLGCRK